MLLKGELKWQNLLFGFVIVIIIFLVYLLIFADTGNATNQDINTINDLLCFWC